MRTSVTEIHRRLKYLVANLATLKHLGQCVAHLFANAQLGAGMDPCCQSGTCR